MPSGFHLGFLSWEGGGKRDICQAKGGEDYSNTSNAFSRELIDFLKQGGLGACSLSKFLIFSISETVSGGL